ncbi:hypothetical protein [Nocardia sp. BSTN01]|uniref:hypothetical protein n=1 Tax=Nocardia sp. BSTN01 TaxID=2783665 RepID=UPI0035CCFA5B
MHAEPETAVAAWVETRWKGEGVISHDAKPLLRAGLGALGVVAQFLDANYTPAKPRPRPDRSVPPVVDYAATTGLRDLLRQAGVIDNRLALATAGGRTSVLTREATLVGIHIRQHTPRRNNGRKAPSQLVIRRPSRRSRVVPAFPWAAAAVCGKGQW